MAKNVVCEVRHGPIWISVTIDLALNLGRETVMRCIECHGALRPHRAGRDGVPSAHFEHLSRHKGCSKGVSAL